MNTFSKLNMNVLQMDSILKPDKNFDVIKRSVKIAGVRKTYMYYIDGFLKDSVMQEVLRFILSIKPEQIENINDASELSEIAVPTLEVSYKTDFEEIKNQIFAGCLAFFVEGIEECIIIDSREYPQRSVEEPERDKVLRGAKDGFLETPVFNVAMIRRRIRNEHFVAEHKEIGSETKNDVIVCYMDDRVNKKALDMIMNKLDTIDIKRLPMGSESLIEALFPKKWLNPFPKARFVARPDIASNYILNGRIVIIVDNTPSAIILPIHFVDFFAESVDYYFAPPVTVYLRITRILLAFTTLFLTPLWLLAMKNIDALPSWLSFLKIQEMNAIPLIVQLLVLEFIIDVIKSASINTPSMISTSIALIGAVIFRRYCGYNQYRGTRSDAC